jgi:hypothetical protein
MDLCGSDTSSQRLNSLNLNGLQDNLIWIAQWNEKNKINLTRILVIQHMVIEVCEK